jgi:hypothetical protein
LSGSSVKKASGPVEIGEERTMQDRRLLWALGITSGIAWAAWIYFLFIFDVGAIKNPWDPWRIVFYVLLPLAPVLTFIPIALRLKWYFLAPYAVVGWTAFGFLLAFVRPPLTILTQHESPLSVWYFFLDLFVVLTTILAPIAHFIGLRFLTSRMLQHDFVRAWREAGLLALYLVGMAIARSLGLITWPIVLLGLLFLALVEALFLARKA